MSHTGGRSMPPARVLVRRVREEVDAVANLQFPPGLRPRASRADCDVARPALSCQQMLLAHRRSSPR
eukprot:508130-Heterocapsa_arctica.AAC.1